MAWKIKQATLQKEFQFQDFSEAVQFVNQVKDLANAANHHPDILIHSYNQVKIMLMTHDQNAITDKDHNLAKAIDNLPE